ncbi:MAG: hypothetical protein WBV22_04740 [Anaerolineaceae bacterium]
MTIKAPLIEFIPIDDLQFDPQNPRLPGQFKDGDESEILRWMLNDATLIELMGSIGIQGYFPGEPLLGYRDATGKCVVIEGNRRLAASKLLLHPELAPIRKKNVLAISEESSNKPDTLPVIIYPTRNDIISYLGYRHVTGIKPWKPLEKARYLYELFSMEDGKDNIEKYRLLAKKIGSRADYVAKLLTAYAVYNIIEARNFFEIKDLDEDSVDFSILQTALFYANITAFLGLKSAQDPNLDGLDEDRLKEITDWLFAKNAESRSRIGESRNLSYLSSIVANEKALAAWRSGTSLEYASMLTDVPKEVFNNSIIAAQENLMTAREYSDQVDKPERTTLEILVRIEHIASDLHSTMTSRQG